MAAKAKSAPPVPARFINRELSWLEFNQRVLDEALDAENPLLERVKFFCIVSSNLDEFFEVRVAGLKQQIESDVVERSVDGLTATETFRAVTRRVRQMVDDQYACWREELMPALAKNGIRVLEVRELDAADLEWVRNYYQAQVRPVLTPLAIDPAHPFPQLLNKSLNLIVRLEMPRGQEMLKHLAVVQIPRILPRMVQLPGAMAGRIMFIWAASSAITSPICFRARRFLGTGRFASRATASFTSTKRKRPTCSRRSKTNCTTAAKATPCVSKWTRIARNSFGMPC